jgi:linoleoyl-CoA desaturase
MTDTAPMSSPSPTAELLGARARSLSAAVTPSAAEIRGARRSLHAKALVIATLALGSYWGLVVADVSVLVRLGCAAVLVVAAVGVATGIMHDANHDAFSRSRRVNRIVGCTLDLLGGSSWLWRFKHNHLHHANTNVMGVDSDIDQGPIARMAPEQPWRRWHRYQHIYMWPVYGLLAIRWFLVADFKNLLSNRIGAQPLKVDKRFRHVAGMVAGKLAHLTWALAIPLALNPWWGVLCFYLACSWATGFVLATTFQVAHCVGEADFVEPAAERRGPSFQLHQLRTTVNVRCGAFARSVRWLIGGLDHQIEHHLAPRLPHTIHPLVRVRLESVCSQHHLPYRVHASAWQALRAHGRWLRAMGRATAPTIDR